VAREPAGLVPRCLWEALVADVENREELAHVHPRDLLERLGIGHDMHPAADQQDPTQARAVGWSTLSCTRIFEAHGPHSRKKLCSRSSLRFPLENTFAPVQKFP
jgi:hypothetical protein